MLSALSGGSGDNVAEYDRYDASAQWVRSGPADHLSHKRMETNECAVQGSIVGAPLHVVELPRWAIRAILAAALIAHADCRTAAHLQ